MRSRTIATSIVLCNRMLQIFSNLRSLSALPSEVRSLLSYFSISFPISFPKHSFYTSSPTQPSPSSSSASSSRHETNEVHLNLSTTNAFGITKSAISRCSHLREKKGETFAHTSLKDLLFEVFDLSPEIARRFLGVSELTPEDVLAILLGFQFDCGKPAIEARKVGSLWEIFKWASNQSRGFNHLSRSYEVMSSMLVRVGLLRDVEFLLSVMEARGVFLDNHGIFDNLINAYVAADELKRANVVYDRMRARGLVPSLSCYGVLIDLLVQRNESQLALQIYVDMVDNGFGLSNAEAGTFENVIKLLCKDGKIQEARTVAKKVLALGLKPSSLVFNDIACGYCDKKDFEDLLTFLGEMNCVPDVVIGNRIICSLCSMFGTERAGNFLQELEHLGFCPDPITFGILINWCCHEGKLRSAFIYLCKIFSRCLRPDICSYNALICGVFREGMWKHARDIFHEMFDRGIVPNLSTFRVLLAGYCKARQFDEVKAMVGQMVNVGLIPPSSLEDPLSNAFLVLGFRPLAVRMKRDNDVGLFKTEFFDNLGNGLYLETDLDEYEKILTEILDQTLVLDFNSLVLKECDKGNVKTAMSMVDTMTRWGQELSSSAFSALLKQLCLSNCHVKTITGLLDKVPGLNQLDHETLNLVVQAHSRKGFTYKGWAVLDGMLQRHLKIENETYTSLMMGFCREGNLKGLLDCWDVARKDKWLPGLKNCKVLVGFLCQQGMLLEVLELLETMLAAWPSLRLNICDVFLKNLCGSGYTSIAHVLVEELLQLGYVLEVMAYSHLIEGFFKDKKISEALIINDVMLAKKLAPRLNVAVSLIPILCRAGNFDNAFALKEACLSVQSSISLSVFSGLMNGFCKAGKVGEVDLLFQDMFSKGLIPDAEIYNVLVQAHCHANDLRKVTELLSVMIRKKVSFSISSYRKLVRMMCVEGKILSALNLKDLMLRDSNTACIIVYNILIFHLFSVGGSLTVIKLLDELQEKGLLPDEVTYNFLVYGFSLCKDVSRSLQYVNMMISEELRPSSRNLRNVISCIVDHGNLEQALQLSEVMELRGWAHGSAVQNAIVNGLLSRGEIQKAENFLDRMIEKDLIPHNINYDHLIKRFCWYGRINKASDLVNAMLKKGNIPDSTSYDSLIQGFCLQNRLDQAADLHTEMLHRNLKPSFTTWDVVIDRFCQDGRTAEADKLLTSMAQIGEIPGERMYHSVINRYRSENNLNRALELLQVMQQHGYEPDFGTHWSLISSLRNSKGEKGNSSPGFLSRLLSRSRLA